MQSLETEILRDRDFKKRVSRPRPSLETPSLITGLALFIVELVTLLTCADLVR